MAVAGGVLFSCTGGRVVPSGERRHPHHRHGDADQARDLPDAREPQLQQPLRQVPRGDGHGRRRVLRQGGPAAEVPGLAARRPPARPGRVPELHERREARRLRQRHLRARVGVQPDAASPRSPTTGSGPESTRSPTTSSRRQRGPPTRTTSSSWPVVRWGDRQPGEHRDRASTATRRSRAGGATRTARTCSCSSRTTAATWPSTTPASRSPPSASSSPRRHRLDLLLGGARPDGLLLERLQRHRRRVPHRSVAPAHAAGGQHGEGHPGQRPARRHVGDAAVRALRPPPGQHGVHAQLGHRHRERAS